MNTVKKVFVAFLLFTQFSCYSEDQVKNDQVIVIPIGAVCTTAAVLDAHGLRKCAFPFDWNISKLESIYELIETDFSEFLKMDNLILGQDGKRILDLHYKMEFVHDFPVLHHNYNPDLDNNNTIPQGVIREDFYGYVDNVYEKYLRRIHRFREALKSDKHVFLIRHDFHSNKEYAEKLYRLIKSKYEDVNLTLVFCSDNQEMKTSWDLPNIFNFYVPSSGNVSKQKEWTTVLQALNLLPIEE